MFVVRCDDVEADDALVLQLDIYISFFDENDAYNDKEGNIIKLDTSNQQTCVASFLLELHEYCAVGEEDPKYKQKLGCVQKKLVAYKSNPTSSRVCHAIATTSTKLNVKRR